MAKIIRETERPTTREYDYAIAWINGLGQALLKVRKARLHQTISKNGAKRRAVLELEYRSLEDIDEVVTHIDALRKMADLAGPSRQRP